jgi:hypothetical protein
MTPSGAIGSFTRLAERFGGHGREGGAVRHAIGTRH